MLVRDRKHELQMLGWMLHGAGVLAVLAGGLFAYFALIRPLRMQEQECLDRTTQLDSLLQLEPRVRAEHERLKTSLADISTRSAAVRQRIPDKEGVAEFLGTISQIANQEHVKIRETKQGEVARSNNCSRRALHLSLEGDYRGICGFLEGLAKLPRVTSVTKLDLSVGTSPKKYPVEMTVVLYFGLTDPAAESSSPQTGTEAKVTQHGS